MENSFGNIKCMRFIAHSNALCSYIVGAQGTNAGGVIYYYETIAVKEISNHFD